MKPLTLFAARRVSHLIHSMKNQSDDPLDSFDWNYETVEALKETIEELNSDHMVATMTSGDGTI